MLIGLQHVDCGSFQARIREYLCQRPSAVQRFKSLGLPCGSVVECLPSMRKVLGFIPCPQHPEFMNVYLNLVTEICEGYFPPGVA